MCLRFIKQNKKGKKHAFGQYKINKTKNLTQISDYLSLAYEIMRFSKIPFNHTLTMISFTAKYCLNSKLICFYEKL